MTVEDSIIKFQPVILLIAGVTLFVLLLIRWLRRHDLLISYDSSEAKANAFKPFSLIVLISLHCLTAGIFSNIWLCLAHGSMPKIRRDDPSAAWAFLAHWIPFYNMYWVFFHHLRLCYRINEQRAFRGLEHKFRLRGMAIITNALLVVGLVANVFGQPEMFGLLPLIVFGQLLLIGYEILLLIYVVSVQRAINELAILTIMENLVDSTSKVDESPREMK